MFQGDSRAAVEKSHPYDNRECCGAYHLNSSICCYQKYPHAWKLFVAPNSIGQADEEDRS